MRTEPMRALVIEDERGAREDLLRELAQCRDVDVVGCADGVRSGRPFLDASLQLLLLDIELADGSGFDLLPSVPATTAVVVVSASESHALRAIQAGAVDYLLKPVTRAALGRALSRAAQYRGIAREAPELAAADCLFLEPSGADACFVPLESIVAVEADGDYSCVRTADGRVLRLLRPLHEWEARLPAPMFARIHRGTVVNLRRVRRIEPWLDRRFRVHLDGMSRPLMMSRRYVARLRERMR